MYTPGTLRLGAVALGCAVLLAVLAGCNPTVMPTVAVTDPTNGATGVPLNTKIAATFSTAIDSGLVTATTFTLTRGGTPVAGTVEHAGTTATFTPTENLLPNTLYMAMITRGDEVDTEGEMQKSDTVRDHAIGMAAFLGGAFIIENVILLAGHNDPGRRCALAQDYLWTFTTGGVTDITASSINSSDPANGAKDVALKKQISVTFSEGMDPLTINTATFLLKKGATAVPGVVAYADLTATFSPASDLSPNTLYNVVITTGAADLAGNKMTEDHAWSFTTGTMPDTTAPAVSSTNPPHATTDVPFDMKIAATFSEAMDPLTITATTFTISHGMTPVSGTVDYAGVTAVFTPTTTLAPDSEYIATITVGAQDLVGNALTGDFVWTFTTGETPDTTAPAVSSTDPAAGETDISVATKIAATFSEAMDPLTITADTFTVSQGSTPVEGTVSYAGVSALFTPAEALGPNAEYTATISVAAADLAGNTLESSHVWTFTTGAIPDTTAPTVNLTDPATNATEIVVDKTISITFSEAMNPLTVSTATIVLNRGMAVIVGAVHYAGVTALFNPAADLLPNTLYTVTVTTAAADLSGNPMASDYLWTFTTGEIPDTIAPNVSSTDPLPDSIDVPLNKKIAATFSETMNPLTITTATFTLKQGATSIPGSVTYAGVTALFSPAANLAPNTLYTGTVTMVAADLAGNELESDRTWNFTTGAAPDVTAPTVSSTNPANAAINVPLDKKIAATFSEAMNPLKITTASFTLSQGATPVTGTVAYAGVTAVFSPAGILAPNTLYTATITTLAADLAGNALAANHTWSFTTGATPDTTAPTVSTTDPVAAATGVPVNKKVAATFSEAMDPLTITTATFTLHRGTTPVAGSVVYTGTTATFTPTGGLLPTTVYTASVWMDATDLAGNKLASDHVWTFTTGALPDTTAPAVSSTDPLPGATNVPVNKKVAATFSEAMDPLMITTVTFTLYQGATPVFGAVTYAGVTASFTPTDDLAPSTLYTATITTGVKDLAGNALADDHVWSFTTGALPDTAAPTISSTNPANAATAVPVDKKIAATFSEAMDPLTITTMTFALYEGTTPVSGAVTYAGVSTVFTPSGDLLPGTLYTATITTGVEDLAGNALANEYVWTFTTGVIPDTLAPTVSSTDPMDGATSVAVNKKIAATFSEAMDPLTVTTATFTIFKGLTPVAGTVIYAGVTATFTPTGGLSASTLYTATITTGTEDLAGNALADDYVWSFTTGIIPDTLAPTVSSTNPANAATAVPVDKKIAATFSEVMDPLTITTAAFTLSQGVTPVSGAVTYAGVTATFTPTVDLAPSTVYTATILAGVEDLAGNVLANDYVWSFTTGVIPDTTAPSVSSTDPMDTATAVPVNKKVAATFSEAMDPLTVTTATFTLNQGATPVSGTVTYAGVTATFTPASNLAPSTTYTAVVLTDATDLAGNALLANHMWTFTTGLIPDTTRPGVSSTNPMDSATNVPVDTKVAATFSEAIDPLTITTVAFLLEQGATPVSGTVAYAGVTATFTPTGDLLPTTMYTATITTTVADLAGNTLANDYVWSFTTGALPDTTAPMVSSTDPMDGATNVPVNKQIAATFSEAMDSLTISTATFILNQGITPVAGTVTYAGVTATFAPTGDLAPSTQYTAAITIEAMDLAGNALIADHVWSFTTGALPDTTAPTVSFTDPVDTAINVPVNKQIAATFSEAMDPLTVTTVTFTVTDGIDPVPGTVIYAGVTATFSPTGDLAPSTLYTATITMAATDLAGNPLLNDYAWTFTTGLLPDTTPPQVSTTDPMDAATDVPVDAMIAATFTEAMDALTVTTATFTVAEGVNPVAGTVTYAGVTATFAATGGLAPTTLYTATITATAADLAGNTLVSDYVWTFTTGVLPDTTAPDVDSTDPMDLATDVSVNKKIAATFTEAMDALTITTASFTLMEGVTPVDGTVIYAGLTATFTPTGGLLANTTYTAAVLMTATDLAGNALTSDYVWSFTTGAMPDTTAPLVDFTDPIDGAIGVPINKKVSATFSEAMDALTITTLTFTVNQGVTPVDGTVIYAGLKATFTPTGGFVVSTPYTATISITAADLAGNPLAAEYVWDFTTGITTAQDPIDMLSATTFAILAGSTVTVTNISTTVTGDLGVSPGLAVDGFPPGTLIGSIYTGVASPAGQAKDDLVTAFNEASARSIGSVALPGDLSSLTLYPGLYTNSSSVQLAVGGQVTLDAQGDADAVFLFKMGSTLTGLSSCQVILSGGAKAGNVYWWVGSSATLGTGAIFKGNILAQESITMETGANLEGRALTQTAAVSLDAAIITVPTP